MHIIAKRFLDRKSCSGDVERDRKRPIIYNSAFPLRQLIKFVASPCVFSQSFSSPLSVRLKRIWLSMEPFFSIPVM